MDRRRRVRDEQVEERSQVGAGTCQVEGRGPGPGVRVDDRELDLLRVRAEVHEELVDHVDDLRGPGVAAIDLVDRDDDRQSSQHRLREHVAGLRQGALRSVDEEQDRVDHQQAALDLAAEVGMARRVHDVQAHVAVHDAGLLGHDRDAALALEVHGIHDAIRHDLVDAEDPRLAEHRVDERRLAVVDVGDDREVADVQADSGGGGGGRGGRRGARHGRPRSSHAPGIVAESSPMLL